MNNTICKLIHYYCPSDVKLNILGKESNRKIIIEVCETKNKYARNHREIMFKNYQDNRNRKIFLTSISAAVLVGSFVIGSQLVQSSMAQDLGQMGEQAKEKIGGAVFEDGQYTVIDEIKNTNQIRTLIIGFDKGTQEIEIIGTQIPPLSTSALKTIPVNHPPIANAGQNEIVDENTTNVRLNGRLQKMPHQ